MNNPAGLAGLCRFLSDLLQQLKQQRQCQQGPGNMRHYFLENVQCLLHMPRSSLRWVLRKVLLKSETWAKLGHV